MSAARCLALAVVTLHSAAAHAEPLGLAPGKTTDVECQTKAVVVADAGAKATAGRIVLRLTPPTGAGEKGRWTVPAVEAAHNGSFTHTHHETCKDGCPLDPGADGAWQAWAPAPKTIDALAEGEVLTIAVIKSDGALRASTFRGKQIEALEQGTCGVPPNAPGAAAGPAATEK